MSAFKKAQVVGARLSVLEVPFLRPSDGPVAVDTPETPLWYFDQPVLLRTSSLLSQSELELKDDHPPIAILRCRPHGGLGEVELVRANLYSPTTLFDYEPFTLPLLEEKVVVPSTLTFELMKGDTELPALFFWFQFSLELP